MQKLLFALTLATGILLGGCSGSDSGDVSAATKASEQAVRSADELPKTMTAEERKAAESAMAQGKAMQSQMNKEADAMKRFREKSGQ